MKTAIHFVFLLLILSLAASGQIITPVVKANFGVDADLRSNFNNNVAEQGNDDWFQFPTTTGTGQSIIDTTGAAAIIAGYRLNPASRRQPFMKNMRFPVFTVVNNHLLMDATFYRDYHGDDSTVFASGSNKNGFNPANWSCPVSQGIPDKNDILDMMVHVRRAGPSISDSLWMFGGISLDNTTGNRYFDFEMYQTDLTYNRTDRKFSGEGPDAGHTSWEFDAAGNVVKPGDIIFSAEYQSSALSMIEARIWIKRSDLSMTPAAFDWSGKFDGASSGATYGYASIKPKGEGSYFTGLQSTATWGGPFNIILQNDAMATDYIDKQFVEFSVNLTKLGLDPVTLKGNENGCILPFRSILVKTRSSASFTAELKDFVLPFTFFDPPTAKVTTATPYLCDKINIAELNVSNPVPTSHYRWSTIDGNIISDVNAATIYVNKPGTYIVSQYLQAECLVYAADTMKLGSFPFCSTLAANAITDLKGAVAAKNVSLSWKVQDKQQVGYFEIEKSLDGNHFTTAGEVKRNIAEMQRSSFTFQLLSDEISKKAVHYRIRLFTPSGAVVYSDVLRLEQAQPIAANEIKVYPNPVKDKMFIQVLSTGNTNMKAELYNAAGARLHSSTHSLKQGANLVSLDALPDLPTGFCFAILHVGNEVIRQKIAIAR